MRNKTLRVLALSALMGLSSSLASCGKQESSVAPIPTPTPEPSSSQTSSSSSSSSAPVVIDDFAPGDGNAHMQQEERDIDTIRFHYHRFDDTTGTYTAYKWWSLWIWDMTNGGNGVLIRFDHYDEYGIYADIPVDLFGKPTEQFGFIVCRVFAGDDWRGKDPDGDRSVMLEGVAHGGKKDYYLVSGVTRIYEDPQNAFKPYVKFATLSKDHRNKLSVYFADRAGEFVFSASKLKITLDGQVVNNYEVELSKSTTAEVTFTEPLDLSKAVVISYAFDDDWTDKTEMLITKYYDSQEFKDTYLYDGEDLGVTFDNPELPTKTTFKLWAPTSSRVRLFLYESGDYYEGDTPVIHDMERQDKGIYAITLPENLSGKYYTYEVTNSKGVNEVVDPYARSAGVNGRRGMIVNFQDINKELNWEADERPDLASPADASIYEIHVRDMTINPNSGVSKDHRGRFLGLTEEGTTYMDPMEGISVSTGLDHMAELGVTHIQIQPFYDFVSVDELDASTDMRKDNYNWGYDPQNYNVLEGSYSTNPHDGEVRIKEFKQAVQAMHQKGLHVNMDVVYNHTGSTEQSNFNLIVPSYYYRTNVDGSFLNGSGCGNEVASNREMMRKFIVESTKFWTEEYHLSGFRFDLMGLEDNQTMIDVFQAVQGVYDKAMVYGEPWDMGSLKTGIDPNNLSGQKTLQRSLSQNYFYGKGNYVGAFNDGFRNGVRGGNAAKAEGYVTGDLSSAESLLPGIQGLFSNSEKTLNPEQNLNYASCHDNYTLYDQLIQAKMTGERDFKDVFNQANALVTLSQGVAFLQEGDDFMRSKSYLEEADGNSVIKYDENSYKSGDFINDMDYALKAANRDVFEKTKEMLAVRNENKGIALDTREEIQTAVAPLMTDKSGNAAFHDGNGNIGYSVNAHGQSLIVLHSQEGTSLKIPGFEVVFVSNENTCGFLGEDPSDLVVGRNGTVVLKLQAN